MNLTITANRNYDMVARVYADYNYKKNQHAIIQSKLFQLKEISSGDKVLFAGSGPGEDSLAAAKNGAQITCVDISKEMLAICEAKFKAQTLGGRFIHQDIMEHNEIYDIVIANYFLNVFDRKTAAVVLAHLAARVKPHGMLMIADVAPPIGNPFFRAVNLLGYWSVAGPAALVGLTALHRPYEYRTFLPEAGLQLKWEEHFRLRASGPVRYKTWAAVKTPLST
jgi:demethylphylloquinol methyltransferase